MENGLIFPYPCIRAHDEFLDANHPRVVDPSGEAVSAWDPIG
jgi:hypothetical protein